MRLDPLHSIGEAIAIGQRHRLRPVSARCAFNNRMDDIMRFVRESTSAASMFGEVPGYRLELTPFGGIKATRVWDIREGVQEAMKKFHQRQDVLDSPGEAKGSNELNTPST